MVDLWLTRFVPMFLIVIGPVKYRLFFSTRSVLSSFQKNKVQPFFNSSTILNIGMMLIM